MIYSRTASDPGLGFIAALIGAAVTYYSMEQQKSQADKARRQAEAFARAQAKREKAAAEAMMAVEQEKSKYMLPLIIGGGAIVLLGTGWFAMRKKRKR